MIQSERNDPEPPQVARFNEPRRWAVRLAFPLLALGVLAAMRAVREPETSTWEWIGIGAIFVMAVVLVAYGRRDVRSDSQG